MKWVLRLFFTAGILVCLRLTRNHSYLLFHSLVELFSVIVAVTIFVVVWNTRRLIENNYLLFLGISFLFTGGFDLLHTLAYKGMGVFPAYDANLPTQLWIAARYLQAFSFLLAPIFLSRPPRPHLVFAGYTAVTVLLIFSIFFRDLFPDSFIEGKGLTAFKKTSEYVICLFLALSAVLLYRKKEYFDGKVLWLLIGSLTVSVAAELSLTSYASVYGFANALGHYFKILAFYLIYKAVVETSLMKPYSLLFRDLKRKEEDLREFSSRLEVMVHVRTTELANANAELRQENLIRRETEKALAQQKELLEAIVDNIPAMLVTCDDAGTLRTTNRQFGQMFGTAGDAREAADAVQCLDDEDRPRRLWECLKGAHAGWHDIRLLERNNGVLETSWAAVRLSDGTHVGIGIDVSERKRAEDTLRRYAEKLEWSNRELQDFAFVASHDLQEPLRKIQTFGSLLKTRYGALLDETASDYIQRMQNSAERMRSLIRALLEYSRVNSMEETFSQVNLNETAAEAVSDLQSLIEETGATVTVGSLTTIEAEPLQMYRFFLNLIGNALKFHGSEPPVITVSGEHVGRDAASPYAQRGWYRIRVRDNGIGFDEKYLHIIFTPFQRLHGRDSHDGTGMGLAICRRIAVRHGGTITAESREGEGSTFIVTLPVKQPVAMRP